MVVQLDRNYYGNDSVYLIAVRTEICVNNSGLKKMLKIIPQGLNRLVEQAI